MTTFIVLLRGINVGGHNKMPMQDLRDMLAVLGCEDVKTYIQSGNVVLRSSLDRTRLSTGIEAAIAKRFGFTAAVLLMNINDFQKVLSQNPFAEAAAEPKSLHISFLSEVPTAPDLASLKALKSPSEQFELRAKAFYLHAPDGIGRSKLAARVEACLGVSTTSRNGRTASKIAELAESIGG